MAEELIRKTNLLGNNKVIVGNGQTDVVLDTLGKVYIKTGNNLKVLTDIISQISKLSKNKSDLEILNKVLIINNIENINYPGEGCLVFDLSRLSLYLSYDDRYILILKDIDLEETTKIPENINSSEYVKKIGDTMTGTLTINTTKVPLIVASKKLINNLNTQYLNGHESKEFAQKAIDEYITGHWSFNNVDVNKTLKVKDKAVISNIIGTEQFSGGYLGTGWRIDSNTNTMVIDNLMVRKTMRVFELIVNLIRATNGSVWVTDTCKVKNVFDIQLLNLDDDTSEILDNIWYIPYSSTTSFNYSLKTIDGSHLANYLGLGVTTKYHTFGFIVKCSNNFFNFLTLKTFLLNLTNDYDQNNIDIVCLFDEHRDKSKVLTANITSNSIINLATTPRFYSMKNEKLLPKNEILEIYTYYKYFGTTNLDTTYIKVVEADHEKYPTLKEGDLIRCLKFKDNNIKYYDALVVSAFNSYFYIIIVAPSIFDKGKDDNINVDYYSRSNLINIEGATLEENQAELLLNPNIILDNVLAKDEVVRIGSISDSNRLGSVYLSSSEEDSPVIRVLNGVNKPDFSVAYRYPLFLTRKPEEGGPKKYYKIEGDLYIYYDTPNLNCVMATEKNLIKSIYNNHIKTQLGNLKSIENDVFGEDQPEGYGLYGSNVYLTGEFYLNNGKSVAHIGDNITLEVYDDLGKAGFYIKQDSDKPPHIEMLANLVIIRNGDKIAALFTDGSINADLINVNTLKFNLLLGKNKEGVNTISINALAEGESILYYSNGTIMNGKFTFLAEDDLGNILDPPIIAGCREYYFKNTENIKNITPLTIDVLKQALSENKNLAHFVETKYADFIIKIVDYFEDIIPLVFKLGSFLTITNFETLKTKLLANGNINTIKNDDGKSLFTLLDSLRAFFNKCKKVSDRVINYYNTNKITSYIPQVEKDYRALFIFIASLLSSEHKSFLYCRGVEKNKTSFIFTAPAVKYDVTHFWYTSDIYGLLYTKLGRTNYTRGNKYFLELNIYGGTYGFFNLGKYTAATEIDLSQNISLEQTVIADFYFHPGLSDQQGLISLPDINLPNKTMDTTEILSIPINISKGRYFKPVILSE